MKKYAIIIIAAGASRRLGKAKQLLQYKGQSLLARSVDTALKSAIGVVVVVLGAEAAKIQDELKGKPARKVINKDWATGMASSIRMGLTYLRNEFPEISGVVFMVCDQPFVSSEILRNLVAAHEATNLPIVVSDYGGGWGVPAFFDNSMFSELVSLEGDAGAKKVIRQYPDKFCKVPFPEGHFDVDTIEAYQELLKRDQS